MNYEMLPGWIKYYNYLVPQVFTDGSFPADFSLMPDDWALREEIIRRPGIKAVINGEEKFVRPMSTMDVEFAWDEMVKDAKDGKIDLVKNYGCGLGCPGCFSEANVYGDRENLMKWDEIVSELDNARDIGLYSIKFLGPGELIQNPDIFDILDAIKERDIKFSIFTKGAELGSDELAGYIHGKDGLRNNGINTTKELVARLAEYDNVRILLGFNSFIPQIQDAMVGSYNKTANYTIDKEKRIFENRGVANYTEKRNQALANMVEAGFNSPEKGQRLSLIAAPVGLNQLPEIPCMYEWAAKRNMPLVIAPTMESGDKSKRLAQSNMSKDPEHDKLVDLYVAVYSIAIEKGVMALDRIKSEGISAYMGTSPCNQVANGLYMRLNGQIQLCPGRSDETAVYGNIHDKSLAEIWTGSPNYALGPLSNNWCKAKVDGMPELVAERVLQKLSEKYQ